MQSDKKIRAAAVSCAFCGGQIQNIRQKYCSKRCKNRANYIRRRAPQLEQGPPPTRICKHCRTSYSPAHGNAIKYCSAKCRRSAAEEKRQYKRNQAPVQADTVSDERTASEAQVPPVQSDFKAQFRSCLETLLQARKTARDTHIDSTKYKQELFTITQYLADGSPIQRERDAIQSIFQSLK